MRSKRDRVMCGTCEFWTGERTPSVGNKESLTVDIKDRHGYCRNSECRHDGEMRWRDWKCVCYEKWTDLL